MTALYLFCAAVGIPLLLWFSFAGDADGGDGFGDADADGPLAFLSLSTMSFVLGFFGLTGLLLEIVGTAGLITLLVAIITAVAAASISFLHRLISRAVAANGTIISGDGMSPFFWATAQAASKMARACIRQISG